eukprot:m.350376 g.350376  ORF g.350376 m.350376 type:complete len:54 (+) comp47056_c0_seq1:137-298(+)
MQRTRYSFNNNTQYFYGSSDDDAVNHGENFENLVCVGVHTCCSCQGWFLLVTS